MRHGLVPDRNCSIRNKRKLLPIGSDACFLKRLSYGVELIVGSDNNILILLGCQLLCAGFQSDLEQPVFVNARLWNGDLAFSMEHVRNASARCEVAVVLGENSANLRSSAVLVVCRSLNHDRHAARRVTFINDLVQLFPVPALTRAAFDCALNVIVGHALGSRSLDRAAQTRVATSIAPA